MNLSDSIYIYICVEGKKRELENEAKDKFNLF